MLDDPTAVDAGLLASGFGSVEVARLTSWPDRVERMLQVERELAAAQAELGLIPADAAAEIATTCRPENVDLAELAGRAARAATPVIPLVAAVRDAASASGGAAGAAYLHHGVTSQDLVDTAMVLQVRDALDHLDAQLARIADRLASLATEHRDDPAVGRTLLQQTAPVTLGLRFAHWLAAIDRRRRRLATLRPDLAVLQFGGVVGTLSVYGDHGPALARRLAERLGLGAPTLAWHTERDRVVDLAGSLAAVVSVVSKVAGDLVLLAQTEVGEVAEAPAGATSSAVPHKRNPVNATASRAACRLASGEIAAVMHAGDAELERAAGAWQSEWVSVPGMLVRVGGAVERLGDAFEALQVDAGRAAQHLAEGDGLVASELLMAALVESLGRPQAQSLVAEVAARVREQGSNLHQVAQAEPRITDVLSQERLAQVTDPLAASGVAGRLVDETLAEVPRDR